MARQSINLQDNFLNQARREALQVAIILLDGTQITCEVKGFDNFTVVVTTDGGAEHLLYKHAIAQMISPKALTSTRPPFQQNRGPRSGGGGGGGRGPRSSGPQGGDRRGPAEPPQETEGGNVAAEERQAPAAPQPTAGNPKSEGGKGGNPPSGFNKMDLSHIRLEEGEKS